MKKLGVILCAIIFVACDNIQEIETDFPAHVPQPVINALCEPDKEFTVRLSVSQSPGQSEFSAISDADVQLIVDGTVYAAKAAKAGIYYFDYIPGEGCEYEIIVHHARYGTLSAKDRVPDAIRLVDFSLTREAGIDEAGDIFSDVAVTLAKGERESFIEILFFQDYRFSFPQPDFVLQGQEFQSLSTNDALITSQPYYPSILNYGQKLPESLLFSDKPVSENLYTVHFQYSPGMRIYGASKKLLDGDCILYVRSVSENYYKYKTGCIEQGYSLNGNTLYGMGEPVPVFSNIQGGLGIVASYISQSDTIFVGKP